MTMYFFCFVQVNKNEVCVPELGRWIDHLSLSAPGFARFSSVFFTFPSSERLMGGQMPFALCIGYEF